MPGEYGTGVTEGWYPPRHWSGTCAMVKLNGGAIIIGTHHLAASQQLRRCQRAAGKVKNHGKTSSLSRDNPVTQELFPDLYLRPPWVPEGPHGRETGNDDCYSEDDKM